MVTLNTWFNLTLGEVLNTKDVIKKELGKLKEELKVVDSYLNAIGKIKADVDNGISALNTTLTELSNSGVGFILLKPEKGNWSARLNFADNAPSTNSNMWSTGIAIIAVGADYKTIVKRFKTIGTTLSKDYKELINMSKDNKELINIT